MSDLSHIDFDQVKDLIDPMYREMDLAATIDYFYKFFVEPCPLKGGALSNSVIADLGCGYGWLAFAFALNTDARIIATDIDASRVATGAKIATLLGVEEQIEWRVGSLTKLPFRNREATIGYTVEALEHIHGDRSAFSELVRVCDQYIVATTPNRWFPLIAHDTRLPFCHWLPAPMRDSYAKLFGRSNVQDSNLFWSEADLRYEFVGFERTSRFMQFDNVEDYISRYPTYLPYNGGEIRQMGAKKRLYSKLASYLGEDAAFFMPNLSGVWQRQW